MTISNVRLSNVPGVVPESSGEHAAAGTTPFDIPPPAIGWSDPAAAALAALAEFLGETRKGQRALKQATDAMEVAAAKREVSALREKADAVRTGALMSSCILAASAGASFAAYCSTPTSPAPAETSTEAYSSYSSQRATAGWLSSSGETLRAGSRTAESFAEANAIECDADAAAARAEGARAKNSGEDCREMSRHQAELLSKAVDAIKALLDMRHSAMMSVLSHRG